MEKTETIPENIHQSKWGFHPCSRETFLKLKKINYHILQAKKKAASWHRWKRKAKHNRHGKEPQIDELFSKKLDGENTFSLGRYLGKRTSNSYWINDKRKEIEYIKNPSKTVQLAAVKQDSRAIQFVKNSSKKVQLVAVKQNGWVIQYIKRPSKAVQLAAVEQNGYAIMYIKNSSEEVQLIAVKQDPSLIKYIKNPTQRVRVLAGVLS